MEANNVKAMREALKQIHELLSIGGKPDTAMCIRYEAANQIARDALSKPPRNCDVGTALDQSQRFMDFCRPGNRPPNCEKCKVYPNRMNKYWCQLEWAQMPYAPDTKKEIDEPKSKGDVNEKED